MPRSQICAIIGAGIIGISTAFYLAKAQGFSKIILIDRGQPMGFTSAQSGENYRNWWPHPAMVAFTNRSIDLMEEIARESQNRINMTRRGYALATRRLDIIDLIDQLHDGLGETASDFLRHHSSPSSKTYRGFEDGNWKYAPEGVDILQNQQLIRSFFPQYDPEIKTVLHIRRGGDISGQQMGMHMLEYLREAGLTHMIGEVCGIERKTGYQLELHTPDGRDRIEADVIVNAAGPHSGEIAAMLGVELPILNTFQQKIAFEDRHGAIPRQMPFSIDLDPQEIDWTAEERDTLLEDPQLAWAGKEMPGAIHCRPDGGDNGSWVKLGWAYNQSPSPVGIELPLNTTFPEIVLRGAARLNPNLKHYYGKLPRMMHHYGGWYTMTKENWPLIGPMGPTGSFMNCAMSGFGTMAACAAGELCASWIADADLPKYADSFSISRNQDAALMAQLYQANRGVL